MFNLGYRLYKSDSFLIEFYFLIFVSLISLYVGYRVIVMIVVIDTITESDSEVEQAGPASSTSQPGAASAEVVVIDDDLGDDVVAVGPAALEPVSSERYWSLRIGGRFVETVENARAHGNCIWWRLLPYAPHPRIVDWTVSHITESLDVGYVAAFYIGVTHLVAERWIHPHDQMRGHCRMGWQRMVICAVSDSSAEIANAETSVIAQFRRWGRNGILHSADGHQLCTNRLPGGESAHHGAPPFTLYVCWKFNRGRPRDI